MDATLSSSGDGGEKTHGEPQSVQVEDWEVSFAELNLSDGLKGLKIPIGSKCMLYFHTFG